MQRSFKIGTRGSPLALYQARLVQRLLVQSVGAADNEAEALFPICTFTTSGDKLKGELSDFGGKGLFTKELETALLCGDIDMAVHSMKDVPTVSQESLQIGAVLEREDPRDAFVSLSVPSIADLPQGAVVGTASLRRRAQLASIRPDIKFVLLRGNVGTRLDKLAASVCDATFLAYAGLKRLDRTDAATEVVEANMMLNAPAQGAIGIEVRMGDLETRQAVKVLNHRPTELAITAERAFLRALDGSCRTPIAALANVDGDDMLFKGQVLSLDGTFEVSRTKTGKVTNTGDAYEFGTAIGQAIVTAIDGRNIWDA